MQTHIYEADPFGGGRGAHLITFETDYRFEPRDEFFLTTGANRQKFRVTHVRLEIADGEVRRELLALKL